MPVLQSFLGSLLVALLLYAAYWASYFFDTKKRAYAECWWLPGWKSFRFVIRNMHDSRNLTAVRYRAWLRDVIPRQPGSSVNTFVDKDLSAGERILLLGRQDLPAICFRLLEQRDGLTFVHVDKLGEPLNQYPLGEHFEALWIEYTVRIRSFFLFKHELTRTFKIPKELPIEGQRRDVYREYLLELQKLNEERQVKTVFERANVVTVSI